MGGAATTRMPSSSIVWQTNKLTDVGLDASIFNNKLSITFDYFIKDNINQLGSLPLVSFSGLSQPIESIHKTGLGIRH